MKQIKDKMLAFAKASKYAVNAFVRSSLFRMMWVFPVKTNKIVFSSYRGRQYSDNPKAISDALKGDPKVTIVWILDHPAAGMDGENIRCVREDSLGAYYHLATAGVWVDNCRKRKWISKRKGQYYIQTWHGNIAGKRVEKDAGDTLLPSYVQAAIKDSQMADLFISGSRWASQNYRDAFWYDGPIEECGIPRSDLFYQDHAPFREKVYSFYGLPESVHLVLYAPTFRNDKRLDCYNIDFGRLVQALKHKWGGEWKVLLRLHPNLSGYQKSMQFDDEIVDGLLYQEINELILASDVVITDYSSCMFDAMEARKSVLLYASDLEKYDAERGHYFSMEELPFPLATDNAALERVILDFSEEAYEKRTADFCQRCGICNDGSASQRVARIILEKMGISRSEVN